MTLKTKNHNHMFLTSIVPLLGRKNDLFDMLYLKENDIYFLLFTSTTENKFLNCLIFSLSHSAKPKMWLAVGS